MTNESDQTAIEQVIKNWDDALYHKDIDRLATHYSADCITFDVGDQVEGPEGIKALWEPCLQFFGDHIGIQRKDESVTVSGNLALVTSYNRLTGMASDMDAAKSWLRSTVVFRKVDGEWKIHHEHISFPFDCEKEKPAYILD
jgi:uncharacterized protein (TIGR02246 family)